MSGCTGGGGSDGNDGGSENQPTSMDGVTITDQIFNVRDVNGDGNDDLVIGARFDNSNSQEATLSLAYKIQFPDGSTASDRGGQYTAPPGESSFEGAIRLTAEEELFTESQVENIKDGEYEYDIWLLDVEGVSTGGSGGDSVEGQCDSSVIEDESTNTVEWDGVANGTFEIESVDLTLTNLVDFPVSVTATVVFYGEGGATDVKATPSVSEVLEAGESREFEITRTGPGEAQDWDVELSVSCP